jgi:hypothetical protein
MAGPPLLREVWPALTSELADGLRAQGDSDLAESVATLPFVGACPCGQSDCQSFYTGDPTSAGPGSEDIFVDAMRGMVAVEVTPDRRIVEVSIQGRGDLRPTYRRLVSRYGVLEIGR